MTVLFEPASAVAASICIAARMLDSTARHPRPCGWCEYSIDELRRMVEGYNAWAGYDERKGTYARFEAAVFQGLPRSEQAAQVLAAQAFEPMEAVADVAADADPDPLPAWLTGGAR